MSWIDSVLPYTPLAVIGVVMVAVLAGMVVARREHERRALRSCPSCRSRQVVRASPRPPRDQPHYLRAAHTYRCARCSSELFELVGADYAGPMTGDQLDAVLAGNVLPIAVARRRTR